MPYVFRIRVIGEQKGEHLKQNIQVRYLPPEQIHRCIAPVLWFSYTLYMTVVRF
jgi:hypothetical protein